MAFLSLQRTLPPPDRGESSADPSSLIAEINLLLDFISGRRNLTLGGGKDERLPFGAATYHDALERYFEIREKCSASHGKREPETGRPGSGQTGDMPADGIQTRQVPPSGLTAAPSRASDAASAGGLADGQPAGRTDPAATSDAPPAPGISPRSAPPKA